MKQCTICDAVLDALKAVTPQSITHHLNGESACLQMINDMRYRIDRLKAENAELKIRFGELLQQEFRGHQLQDRMMFTVKGREIVEWWAALDKSAIAKARGES